MLATVKFFFDTRQMKIVGYGIVKTLITFKRSQKLYTTGIKIHTDDWTKLQRNVDENGLSTKLRDKKFTELYEKLYGFDSVLQKAKKVIERLGHNFTFEDFKYQLDKVDEDNVDPTILATNDAIKALISKSATMTEKDRIGNALNYKLAAKSITRFVNSLSDDERYKLNLKIIKRKDNSDVTNTCVTFDQITVDFLDKYEKWMLLCGKSSQKKGGIPSPASSTTVGVYLRHLRSVFNDAIENDVIDRKTYPFTKKGYTIPQGETTKKALKKSVIEQIVAYEAEPNSMEERGRDLWVFSYLCNGMNMTDICNLQWKDIDLKTNKFQFVRLKTINTKKANKTTISGILVPKSLNIIEKWGNISKNDNDYLFPFIDNTMTATRKKEVIKQVIKVTNFHMRKIAEKLDIEGNVLTYAARHSFATILKNSDAPISFIQESLGHSSLMTTQRYLGSFGDDESAEYLKVLL